MGHGECEGSRVAGISRAYTDAVERRRERQVDYGLPDEVIQFREDVRNFIAQYRTPELVEESLNEYRNGYGPEAKRFMRALTEAGFTSVAWPTEYGGQGEGALHLWGL